MPKIRLDDLPISGFHRRVAAVAAGGPLCDGYLLGIIIVVLPAMTQQLRLTAVQSGLIGAASLAGMLIGGLLLGPASDRFGRRPMFIATISICLFCSIAHLFFVAPSALIALRLIIGIALGADYPVATALACEFLPTRLRGSTLASLVLFFWIGFAASLAAGLLAVPHSLADCQFFLASGAVPSILLLALRWRIPESPRWLLAAGREESARTVVTTHLGDCADFDALVLETPRAATPRGLGLSSIRRLFRLGYGRQLAFCSMFWTCQITPSLAIKTFQPLLLTRFGIARPMMGSLFIVLFALVGTGIGVAAVDRIGRRPLLVCSFVVSTISLLLLAAPPATSIVAAMITLFIAFTLAEAAGSALQFVYPNELFPTDVRATGMGLSLSISRVGSAIGTFAMPVSLAALGREGGILAAAAISAVGLIVALAMAPETRSLSINEASARIHRKLS